MALRPYIPINKNVLPELFSFPFGKELFIFGVKYNQSQDYFTIDVYESDMTPIVLGERVIVNQPLWIDFSDKRLPAERIIPMNESAPETPITFDNFGDTVQLYIDNLSPSLVIGASS